MKRLLSLAVGIALLCSLFAGCSGEGSVSSAGNDTQASPQSTGGDTQGGASSGDVVTIRFFHRWTIEPMKTTLENAIAQFEVENPDIKIEAQSATNDAYKERIATVIGERDAPDIYFTWAGEYLEKFVREDLALDITDYLSSDGTLDKLVDGQMDAFRYDGRIYATPIKVDAKLFFYNKVLFAENGWQVPTTYSEFLALCEEIQAAGITPIHHGNVAPYAGVHYLSTLNQKCVPEEVRAVDYRPESGAFTDPGYIRALEIYDELHNYMNADVAALDWGFAYTGFINGECAMIYEQYVSIPDSMQMSEEFTKSNIGMFPFPAIEGGAGNQNLITGSPDGYAVHAATEHPEEAVRFLKFLLSDDVVASYVEECYWVNAQTDVINRLDEVTDIQPMIDGIEHIRGADSIVHWLDTDVHAKIAQVYLEELQRLDNRDTTPEEIMQRVQQVAAEVRAEIAA